MLDKLKLKLLRVLVEWMMARTWRGKRAQNLSIKEYPLPVDGATIRLRVYTPQGTGPFAPVLFMHGGGFVGFSIDTHDGLCRDLCVASGRVFVSVDYRLAPEHPFPTAVHDCFAALDWVLANGATINADVSRLAVCGDSAGGNLAAVMAQQARARHPGKVKAQALVYPCTDDSFGEWSSYTNYGGKGYVLTHKGIRWLYGLYTRDSKLLAGERRHDLLTPLHARDLSGMPPALICLAELDALFDEGKAYAQRLSETGNQAEVIVYPGQQHGFFGNKPGGRAHTKCVNDITGWLKQQGI